jgi:hypothetical protein
VIPESSMLLDLNNMEKINNNIEKTSSHSAILSIFEFFLILFAAKDSGSFLISSNWGNFVGFSKYFLGLQRDLIMFSFGLGLNIFGGLQTLFFVTMWYRKF